MRSQIIKNVEVIQSYARDTFEKVESQHKAGECEYRQLLASFLFPAQQINYKFTMDACAIKKTRNNFPHTCRFLTCPFFSFYRLFFFPPSLSFSLNHCSVMEPLDDSDSKLERVDSDQTSTSSASGISSVFSTDDFRNGDISSISSGSGEIPTCTVNRVILAPPLIAMSNEADKNEPAAPEEVVVTAVTREKCVGMNNKGVSWGHTSVIGRRREMEDAVAVIPGFMSRTCDHVGGCTAPGSRSSGEISPIHFFGVYDGHGGAQVHTFFHFFNLLLFRKTTVSILFIIIIVYCGVALCVCNKCIYLLCLDYNFILFLFICCSINLNIY